jgi:hypothetical protein
VVYAAGVDRAPPSGHVAWADTTAEHGHGLNIWTSRQVRDLPAISYILFP